MRIICCLFASFLLTFVLVSPNTSHADISMGVSFDFFSPPLVAVAPPPLPVYIVPDPPQDGIYMWSPGHWRWNGDDYFWVPGTWVQPPTVGVLWTPGYWGWGSSSYTWHEGYWGPHIGFYGGINYGGGYGGVGFDGGKWNGGAYHVNRSVTNVTNITNNTTYNNTTNISTTNASFNGGAGGTIATPTAEDQVAANETHTPPTNEQVAHAEEASHNPALAASSNHGKPAIAATATAGNFQRGVVAASQAGPRNPAAEQHNAEVIKNPVLAAGAAVPKSGSGAVAANQAGTRKPEEQPNDGDMRNPALAKGTVVPKPEADVKEPDMHAPPQFHESGQPPGSGQPKSNPALGQAAKPKSSQPPMAKEKKDSNTHLSEN